MGPEHKDAADDERAPAAGTPSSAPRVTSYSHVGRRSSARIPAVAVSVEKTTPSARPIAPPLPPLAPPRRVETDEHPVVSSSSWPIDPPTEKLSRPPASARPAAPDPFGAAMEVESIAQTFDRLLASDVEAGFASIHSDVPAPPATGATPPSVPPQGLDEVRALFAQLASHHVRPVRDFLIDLRWGEASRDWVGICRPAVQSLRRAAEKLDLADLIAALDELDGAMDAAGLDPGPLIEGPARDRLLVAHDALVEVLPAAFALDMDRSQREAVIVQSLLVQIPEVRKVTLDHLYAAGLNTVEAYAAASPSDLAAATGVPLKLAAQIVDAFRAHKADVHASSSDVARTRERARVGQLVGELEALNTAFERASVAWSAEATEEKKRTRRARTSTLMQINVILARLGEVARLRDIERLPFDRKLEAIRTWLREAQGAASEPTI